MAPPVTRDDATWFRTWLRLKPGVAVRAAARPPAGRADRLPAAAREGLHGHAAPGSRALPAGEGGAGARVRGPVRGAARQPAGADRARRAGGAGAADRLRQRRQPDDRAGLVARPGDGAARLDRRRAVAAGAAGAGGKRLDRRGGVGARRTVRLVGRAVRRRPDQSAGQPGAARAARGLARPRVRRAGYGDRDRAVRSGPGAAGVCRRAGDRAEGRRGPARTAWPDARADCRSGGLLRARGLPRRPAGRHIHAAVATADRVLGGGGDRARSGREACAAAARPGTTSPSACARCRAWRRWR